MKRDKLYGNSVHSPCKECSDRHMGCHAKCDKYKDFKTVLYKAHRERYKLHNAECRAENHEVQSKERTLKRQRKM